MKTALNKKEVITKDNVKRMGETIAVACARNRCAKYYSERAKKLYDGLVYDVYHHNGDPAQNYSDGYDLAMEAITFLCEHIGKSLSDTATVLKYGKPKRMTVLNACFFIISQYITKQVTFTNRTKSIDDPTFAEPEECVVQKVDNTAPTLEYEFLPTAPIYSAIKVIVKDEFNDLAIAVGNKLDKSPMHEHDISQIDGLQTIRIELSGN